MSKKRLRHFLLICMRDVYVNKVNPDEWIDDIMKEISNSKMFNATSFLNGLYVGMIVLYVIQLIVGNR